LSLDGDTGLGLYLDSRRLAINERRGNNQQQQQLGNQHSKQPLARERFCLKKRVKYYF